MVVISWANPYKQNTVVFFHSYPSWAETECLIFINGIPILVRQHLYITKVLLCTLTQIQSTWNIRRRRFYLQFPSNCLAFVCIVQLIIPFTSQTSGKLITGYIEGGTAQKIDQLLRIDILKLLFVYMGIGQWHHGLWMTGLSLGQV